MRQLMQTRRHARDFQGATLGGHRPAQSQENRQSRGIKIHQFGSIDLNPLRVCWRQLRHPLRKARIGLGVQQGVVQFQETHGSDGPKVL